jgi:hypothetical protein
MRLHEINQANQVIGNSILIDEIVKYKKSLITYWSDMYNVNEDQLILVVTSVFNSGSYGFITEVDQYTEVVQEYVDNLDLSKEDADYEFENINFNSIQLNKL